MTFLNSIFFKNDKKYNGITGIRKIPTRKIPTQKIPTWNIPIHVLKHSLPNF